MIINSKRKNCKDVFNAFLVSYATYVGDYEIPCIRASYDIPKKLVLFSKALSCKDCEQWVHFYEDDYLFERIWKSPERYLDILKKYKGVILPDFSLYRDMPLAMQIWNIYRSRALGNWFQINGIRVIPNIRFGDRRTFDICCEGISEQTVIAIGSHGNIKNKIDREIFIEGFDYVVRLLKPIAVIVYGSAPEKYFKKYYDSNVKIIRFDSDYFTSHKVVD